MFKCDFCYRSFAFSFIILRVVLNESQFETTNRVFLICCCFNHAKHQLDQTSLQCYHPALHFNHCTVAKIYFYFYKVHNIPQLQCNASLLFTEFPLVFYRRHMSDSGSCRCVKRSWEHYWKSTKSQSTKPLVICRLNMA